MYVEKKKKARSVLESKWIWSKLELELKLQVLRGCPRLRANFERRVGYKPNFRHPTTFNEKINWRKIYDHNPLYPIVSDKLRVRTYAKCLLGEAIATPMLTKLHGAYKSVREIDFSKLPANLALKANHASGFNAFLREGETVDETKLRQVCQSWLTSGYGNFKHEWAYRRIPRRIVAEELLTWSDGRPPNDLKLNMFGETLAFGQIDQDLFGDYRQDNIDENWERLPFLGVVPASETLPEQPRFFDNMLAVARRIGREFDYIRVDFLYTDQGFWLNELSLYRGSGMNPFTPPEYDRILGEMWTLPDLRVPSSRAKFPAGLADALR